MTSILDRNRTTALNFDSVTFWTKVYIMKLVTCEGDEEIGFFSTFVFLVVCKGVLRHRCTLNAIVTQYSR